MIFELVSFFVRALVWIVLFLGPLLIPLAMPTASAALGLWLFLATRQWPEFRAWRWLGSLRRRPAGLGVLVLMVVGESATRGFVFELRRLWGDGNGDVVVAGTAALVILGLFAVAKHTLGKFDMPNYLRYLGGGGIGELRDRFDAAPPENGPALLVPPDLAERLKAEVLGQDQILDELAAGVLRRVELRRPGKPLFVALLVGATGAGKTESAKALARACAPGGAKTAPLVRIDCNELTGEFGVQRLIGAPPGYVGSEAGGQLTQAIMRSRGGVILLDEIEKAHPNVMMTLMTLLDEARLTEQSTGAVADARDFVILATSNAEHERIAEIASSAGEKSEKLKATKDALRAHWRAEQLARFDAIFAFGPLPFEAKAALIVKALLGFAEETGLKIPPGGIAIDAVLAALRRGHALESYGVRELFRALESEVMDGLLEAARAQAKWVRIEADAAALRVVPLLAPEAAEAEKAARADAKAARARV